MRPSSSRSTTSPVLGNASRYSASLESAISCRSRERLAAREVFRRGRRTASLQDDPQVPSSSCGRSSTPAHRSPPGRDGWPAKLLGDATARRGGRPWGSNGRPSHRSPGPGVRPSGDSPIALNRHVTASNFCERERAHVREMEGDICETLARHGEQSLVEVDALGAAARTPPTTTHPSPGTPSSNASAALAGSTPSRLCATVRCAQAARRARCGYVPWMLL
jgi:hypothetical protein